jgi:hypothetical protein
MCPCRGIRRFPQATEGQDATAGDLARFRHEHIEIACQLHVLKAIVQYMDSRTELALRDEARKESVRAHGNDGARNLSCKHQRLVACTIEIGKHLTTIRNNDHTVARVTPAIATTQNGRALTTIEQPSRNFGDERRLASPSDAQVANADDGLSQAAPGGGMALEPAPAGPGNLRVEKIKQWV